MTHEPDIYKIISYAKDQYKAKHQSLINKRRRAGLKYFNDLKAFIKYSNNMNDMYKNIAEDNPNKKQKTLIVFNMIADMLSNKKLNPTVTELFIREKNQNLYLVFITQSYFSVSKHIRLNSTPYFVLKILNKSELQLMEFNHSSDIDFQEFTNLCKKCTAKPYSF